MRLILMTAAMVFALGVMPQQSRAQDNVDLILPPALASADAPFYRGAQVKIGDTLLPVQEGPLAPGKLAQYQPEKKQVIVSNDSSATEAAKGQALLDVVAALQANDIATAAGQ